MLDSYIKKGSNRLSPDLMSKICTFSFEDRPETANVTIILGNWGEAAKEMSLLLCRFYDVWKSPPMNPQAVSAFFKLVSTSTENNDIEHHRKGGSSGLYEGVTKELLEYLRLPKCGPRKPLGQWWIPMGTTIGQAYIGLDGEPKWTSYSIPKKGGQFDVDPWMLSLFPWLYEFVECKVFAAEILNVFNSGDTDIPVKVMVTRKAVNSELFNLRRCLLLCMLRKQFKPDTSLGGGWLMPNGDRFMSHNKAKRKMKTVSAHTTREVVLANYITFNRHTKVQHAVGAHQDTFGSVGSGKDKSVLHSLENKICIVDESLYLKYGTGRGGAGAGKFVFAILDWQNCKQGRRRRAVLNNLPAAQVPRRVTQRFWEYFTQQYPAVAAEVEADN